MSNIKSATSSPKLKLPPDEMPEDWDDDERMDFLFSAFKKRQANPVSWDAKMDFWKIYIQKFCVINSIISFDETKLKRGFERKSKFPACLGEVLEALQREGKICVLSELTKHGYRGQTWAAWTKEMVVAKPASFAMTKIWSSLGYDESKTALSGETLVCLEALKNRAEALLAKHTADPDCRHSTSQAMVLPVFLKEEGGEEARLAIIYLCKQGKAAVDETSEPALVKFGHKATITEVDRQSAALKKQEAALKRRHGELELDRTQFIDEAKDYLKKNLRQAAKSSLRKKHEVEKRMGKISDQISNVHSLLFQIQDTHSDAQVLASFQKTSAALKATYKETGLDEDTAASVMDELEEALDMHEDVKNMISQPVAGGVICDDEEFEKELADLLAEGDGGDDDGGATTPHNLSIPDLPDISQVPPSPISSRILL